MKLSDYAALSKAVVSERILSAVQASHCGVCAELDTTDECVEVRGRLLKA